MGRTVRKQVSIEPRQDELLKRRARELGVSAAELIRRGIDAVTQPPEQFRPDMAAWAAAKAVMEERLCMDVPQTGRSWTREERYDMAFWDAPIWAAAESTPAREACSSNATTLSVVAVGSSQTQRGLHRGHARDVTPNYAVARPVLSRSGAPPRPWSGGASAGARAPSPGPADLPAWRAMPTSPARSPRSRAARG